MKGCATSCVLWLLGWGAAAGAFYYYFVNLHDFGPPMYWASAFAGLFVVAIVAYARGIGLSYRERKMLLEAVAGTPPADGEWVAVSGTIHSMNPLTAPISGASVVAYEYKIHRHERFGRNNSEIIYYQGKALAPSTISTRQGGVRLLSVPMFNELQSETIPWQQAVERAKEYVSRTTFELMDTSQKRRTKLEDEWTDDDGEFRLDRRRSSAHVDLAEDFRFDEKHVKQGEQICAFGLYSRQRGGLIPHENWSNQTRLMRGDAANVAGQLRSRMVKYGIAIVIFSGLIYGIVRLYLYKVATLP